MKKNTEHPKLTLEELRLELRQSAIPEHERKAVFFKTGPGEYAEHDKFLGVTTPQLRKLAKIYKTLTLDTISILLQSPINEERLLALIMMAELYQKGDANQKQRIVDCYITHMKHVNNWNLVDASAHLILGAHLHECDKDYLLILAESRQLWERRIAIVSTWYFIRQNEFEWTTKLAEILLKDEEDLIHKAVGWMLREMGKRDENSLIDFLDQHAHHMPRTMLRYAIEKLTTQQKQDFMARKH